MLWPIVNVDASRATPSICVREYRTGSALRVLARESKSETTRRAGARAGARRGVPGRSPASARLFFSAGNRHGFGEGNLDEKLRRVRLKRRARGNSRAFQFKDSGVSTSGSLNPDFWVPNTRNTNLRDNGNLLPGRPRVARVRRLPIIECGAGVARAGRARSRWITRRVSSFGRGPNSAGLPPRVGPRRRLARSAPRPPSGGTRARRPGRSRSLPRRPAAEPTAGIFPTDSSTRTAHPAAARPSPPRLRDPHNPPRIPRRVGCPPTFATRRGQPPPRTRRKSATSSPW